MTNFTEILFLYLFFGPLCNFLLALACFRTSDVQCLSHYGSSFTHGLQFRNSVQQATSLAGAERNDGFSREVIVLQVCVDDGRVGAPPDGITISGRALQPFDGSKGLSALQLTLVVVGFQLHDADTASVPGLLKAASLYSKNLYGRGAFHYHTRNAVTAYF